MLRNNRIKELEGSVQRQEKELGVQGERTELEGIVKRQEKELCVQGKRIEELCLREKRIGELDEEILLRNNRIKELEGTVQRQEKELGVQGKRIEELCMQVKRMKELEGIRKVESWEEELFRRRETIRVLEARKETLRKDMEEVDSKMDREKEVVENILRQVRRVLEEYEGGGQVFQPNLTVDPPTPSSNGKKVLGTGDEGDRANQPNPQRTDPSSAPSEGM